MADEVLSIKQSGRFAAEQDSGLYLRDATGGYEPDDDLSAQARQISEHYQAIAAADIHRSDILPPITPQASPFIDVANILLHDEMATVGIQLDKEGFHYNFETAKDFWSEHPIRAGTAVALGIVPGLAAVSKMFRPAKFANLPDDIIRATGLVDEATDLTRLSAKERRIITQQHYSIQRMKELNSAVEGGTPTAMQKSLWLFNKGFANSYMETTIAAADNPAGLSKLFAERMQGVVKGDEVARMLDALPDEKHGTAIVKFLNDPAELRNLAPEVRPWAMQYADEARKVQLQAHQEGFISDETWNKVGDIWFPTTRRGTFADEGVTTSIFTVPTKGKKGTVKLVNIPRTTSPHLLERKATKGELKLILNRQQAAEAIDAGKREDAVRLLQRGGDDPNLIRMVEEGDDTAAMGILGEAGIIDTAPATLTVKGLLQQRLLFENFRYLRDVAMDPLYTKNVDEWSALGKAARKNWINLDTLPNSHIVRRMVGKKQGTGSPERLGYVHRDVWSQLTDASTGQPAAHKGMVDMLDVLTAMHKTSKTALNPFTQGQNIAGNYMFLSMAGFNPFSPRNSNLIWGKALPAVWKMQRNYRSGKPLDEIKNLGRVESKIGGADIDIAEELMRPEVSEIIEKSSLLAAEGVGVLDRLSKQAGDSQVIVQGVIRGAQATVNKVPPLNQAIDAYMAEDAMVKLAYYLDLRSGGLSPTGSALEVSRRLPMYHTLGETLKGQYRRVLLPWISFPAEALRIMKNNVMDYPLRSMMYFHGVNALQAILQPTLNESYQGIQDIKSQLPTYAQRPASTLITPLKDSNNDLRAAAIDFLPWSSVLPPSVAPDVGLPEKLPMGIGRPMPILQGIYQALTGRGPMGQEIPTEPGDVTGVMKNMALGMVGFIMPPLVQKYLMGVTTPTPWYRAQQDVGAAVNPYTLKKGDTLYDAFLNNIGGAGIAKFYPSSPEQQLANQNLTGRAIQNYRGLLTKNWNAFIRSGNHEAAGKVMADILRTFNSEWGDPAIAQQKYTEWLKRHVRDLKKHPQLANYTKEELLALLTKMGNKAAVARGSAQANYIATIRAEIANKGSSGGGNPLLPTVGGTTGGTTGGTVGGTI